MHYTHLGRDKTLLKAKYLVYWPFMNIQIIDQIPHSNIKKPLIEQTWEGITNDFFAYQNENYLLIVDLYAKFPELIKFSKDTTMK